MAHQSLYRRYRPRNFAQIKGQQHVVTALRNAVAGDSATHAYMFSGPRGTGKTSTARILAKALNCTAEVDGEPCCECESCVAMEQGSSFDLFELDAASNRGVDSVRDLVERTMVASPGRTKVYILDEVHMLTKEASNALLKTLEEPPEHVRFVLATTDPQKVLPTIRSRTQHFEFHLLPAAELTEHARWVAEDAGLEVDDEAIAHAVRRGKGSVRDTLSALDQVVAAGGVIDRPEPVEELFAALADGGTAAAIVAVSEAVAQGHDPRVLAESFVAEVREAFLLAIGAPTPHLLEGDLQRLGAWAEKLGPAGLSRAMERVGTALVDMRTAADPRVPLEVALIQLTSSGEGADRDVADTAVADTAVADLATRVERLEKALRDRPAEPARERAKPPPPPPRRSRPQAPAPRTESARPEAKTPEPAQPEPAQPEPTQPGLPDRDSLVLAFGDAVVPQLKGIAKAIYTQGRFVAVTGGRAVFALENEPAAHPARKYASEVESLLAARFGVPVPLELVTEAEVAGSGTEPAAAPAPTEADPEPGTPVASESEAELMDQVEDLEEADVTHPAMDRLTEAFPGAELVESETTASEERP
ncbi:MAG: DNA polymerase III subunit gamma/tau [Microthrixaceae bacterium]